MPFNGAGVFERIYNWVTDQANGILVQADRMDTDTDDIAAGLSNCITRDGQSPPTANIPMGGMKLTGLANGINSGDALHAGQVSGNVASGIASVALLQSTAFNTALPGQSAATEGMYPESQGASGDVIWKTVDTKNASSRLFAFNNF